MIDIWAWSAIHSAFLPGGLPGPALRQWGRQGVHGVSHDGAENCGAFMPAEHWHLEESSPTLIQDLEVNFIPSARQATSALQLVVRVSSEPGLMQKLHLATDFALRVTKVMVRALGQAMSIMVEHHLWFNLGEMRDADKICFELGVKLKCPFGD